MESLSPAVLNAFGINKTMVLDASFLYELYKIDWKKQHNITASDERELAIKWHESHRGSSLSWSPDWHGNALLEFGYGEKGCYVCYNEFCCNEMLDSEYMECLIGDDTGLRDLYITVREYFNLND